MSKVIYVDLAKGPKSIIDAIGSIPELKSKFNKDGESCKCDCKKSEIPNELQKDAVPYKQCSKLVYKLYHQAYLLVADPVNAVVRALAAQLVTAPHTTIDDADKSKTLTVSAEVDLSKFVASGKDFLSLLIKASKMRHIVNDVFHLCEDIKIESLLCTEKSNYATNVTIEIFNDSKDFTTLINAVKEIDQFVETLCSNKGLDYEKLYCTTSQVCIRFLETKDGKFMADCECIYAIGKDSAHLDETAEQRISDAINLK